MRPEDQYTAGIAGGAGLGAAGAAAFAGGSRMRREGREQVRANSGGRAFVVRSQRLNRAASDIGRVSRDQLGKLRRVDTKNGPVYMKGGKFAPSKEFVRMGQDAQAIRRNATNQFMVGVGRQARSSEGVKAMKVGRLVRRGGLAAMAAGLGLGGASVAAAERRQSRRTRERDAVASYRSPQAVMAAQREARVNGY